MTTTSDIAQLKAQQAMTVQIIRAFAENRMDGPNSVKWLMAALSPNDPPVDIAPFVVGS